MQGGCACPPAAVAEASLPLQHLLCASGLLFLGPTAGTLSTTQLLLVYTQWLELTLSWLQLFWFSTGAGAALG